MLVTDGRRPRRRLSRTARLREQVTNLLNTSGPAVQAAFSKLLMDASFFPGCCHLLRPKSRAMERQHIGTG